MPQAVRSHRSAAQGAARSPYRAVLASDATPRCAAMASADRQMIGDATLTRDAWMGVAPVSAVSACDSGALGALGVAASLGAGWRLSICGACSVYIIAGLFLDSSVGRAPDC